VPAVVKRPVNISSVSPHLDEAPVGSANQNNVTGPMSPTDQPWSSPLVRKADTPVRRVHARSTRFPSRTWGTATAGEASGWRMPSPVRFLGSCPVAAARKSAANQTDGKNEAVCRCAATPQFNASLVLFESSSFLKATLTNKAMKPRQLIPSLTALALAVIATGCGTMKIPPYTGGFSNTALSLDSQGIVITAEPWTDSKKINKFFELDAQNRGLGIIYVRAENKSTDANWLLTEENCRLVNTAWAGGDVQKQRIEGEYGGASAVGWTGAVLVSPVMIGIAGKLLSDATIMERNMVDKEWRNQTLAPGHSAEGFFYFSVPKKTNWVAGTALQVNTLNTRNQQTSTLLIPLNHETK
jgi:hypothetical protein